MVSWNGAEQTTAPFLLGKWETSSHFYDHSLVLVSPNKSTVCPPMGCFFRGASHLGDKYDNRIHGRNNHHHNKRSTV